MSFQDVGRPGGGARGQQQRGRTQQSTGGAFSSAAAKGGVPRGNNSAAMGNSLSQGLGGYEQVSDSIVQYQVCMYMYIALYLLGASKLQRYSQHCNSFYKIPIHLCIQWQRNVALLEKMARSVGTQNDTSVTQTQ